MNIGWFRISRKLFENEIWYLEPFTKGQAWIDLIGNANHKEGQFEIRGNIITIKRGQIGWSELTMSKRWKWSRNKTRRYLKWLETIHQIEQQKDRYLTTIITIINYDRYQNDTADDTAERQQTIQQTIHKQERIKNENNNKEKRSVEKSPYSEINSLKEQHFEEIATRYQVPIPFVRSKLDDMINWHEKNPQKNYYKNYLSALRDWVKRDSLKIKQEYGKQNSEVSI